jgi:type I restriction enzyme S subunit
VNPSISLVEFAHWQLVNAKQRGGIDIGITGTAQPALSLGDMNNLCVVVPPLKEQELIVESLVSQISKLDALSGIAESGIELLLERRAALISAAVTGKIDVREESGSKMVAA